MRLSDVKWKLCVTSVSQNLVHKRKCRVGSYLNVSREKCFIPRWKENKPLLSMKTATGMISLRKSAVRQNGLMMICWTDSVLENTIREPLLQPSMILSGL